ncbi:similar to Saccharomyces cerevisiae YGR103W NOP7 Component of several different pre-ribosomal particles [Maudiozyma saulgeensis]|uniref:Pescadillo homolog n=1 Tax=Maudiozyma saulgeensis TaxID=1789683 RepID=A0A1X7QXQ5_9SACH|nr:similar to Saccharomyces cerevisiae YGR103W NOP7 Component of several different pre-ribosomal particles [Kazachstania saulgeensis]
MRIKKKNSTGNAKNFITRSQAVRKLQISLADFRRLCIFKGIYPREPRNKKKANKGSTAPTTFYFSKDIQYLMHEPVLAKFREHKTFAKKLTRALGRGEVSAANKLEENRSTYKLDHIIKERYPSFPDALRDIDDALNMLFLFANLPATSQISARVTKDAQMICNQWLAFVAKERLVRKVFVSIKGVYYQATVKGEDIRWLVPYKFPENIPSDIDFRIMLTFLEFYSTLMHFVLYKLYTDSGLVYPPRLNIEQDKIVNGLSSYILESNEETSALTKPLTQSISSDVTTLDSSAIASALNADKNDVEIEENVDNETENVETVKLDTFEDKNKNQGDILAQPSQFNSPVATLFSKFVFYIGREVPLDIVEFLILSGGGSVISEISLDQLEDKSSLDLSKVTHQIVDRPVLKNKVAGRTYVQPQWIFDCINKCELVPASAYLPGEKLPPHLSPWGDSAGYDPEAIEEKKEGEESEEAEEEEEEEEEGENNSDEQEEEEESEDEELAAQKELELEAQGIKYSDNKKETPEKKSKKRKATDEEDEEKKLKMIMMSNKQRKLYKKMKYSNEKKDERIENLKKKKKQITKTKSKLQELNKK